MQFILECLCRKDFGIEGNRESLFGNRPDSLITIPLSLFLMRTLLSVTSVTVNDLVCVNPGIRRVDVCLLVYWICLE